MPAIYIAAAHKSSGKTSITIGLSAAFKNKSQIVQTFKKGPDYIDPIWLSSASGNACYNLDFNTQSNEEIIALYAEKSLHADLTIIEGNKGLYDGVDLEGNDSNAALAKLISSPVILTIDTIGITRGIAPLIQGYVGFDEKVHIGGVILNKVGGPRHESKLIAAIERYTDIPVLGVTGYDEKLKIPERHLGLIPANESEVADKVISNLSETIAAGVDLNKILELAHTSAKPSYNFSPKPKPKPKLKNSEVTIAVAKDVSFGFYYADDLEAFTDADAKLIIFDAINDKQLPEADGLFIGGGFPETQMQKLSENISLLSDIRNSIENGMPVYAECGGLMYLSQSISWNEQRYNMVGAIPGDIMMNERPQGRGYVKLKETSQMLWPSLSELDNTKTDLLPAHEFHYACITGLSSEHKYAYQVKRGTGIDGMVDGLVINNTLSSFSHQRNTTSNPWVARFVNFVRQIAQQNEI